MPEPRRLIEVELPAEGIGSHARREKSLRHGHLATLHPWWARKPLGVCRAEILAAIWPDPADPDCPASFREAVATHLALPPDTDPLQLRRGLADFLLDFSRWEGARAPDLLRTARALVAAAAPGRAPHLLDPFSGGATIPLEGLRLGLEVTAGDLNPVAALLGRVVSEYLPRYGARLGHAVRLWGQWVAERSEQELAPFYPHAPGETPLAYLWLRTVTCQGPGCGAEIPLWSKLGLSERPGRALSLEAVPDTARHHVEMRLRPGVSGDGPSIRRGLVTCPVCGASMGAPEVRRQFQARRGGGHDARLAVVITRHPGSTGRHYRLPTDADLWAVAAAREALEGQPPLGGLPAVPDEPLPPAGTLGFNVRGYGCRTWGDLFTPRQALGLVTLARTIRLAARRLAEEEDPAFGRAVATCLSLALDRQADYNSSLCRWVPRGEYIGDTFARQAISFVWDFAEVAPFSGATGGWSGAVNWVAEVLETEGPSLTGSGRALCASATDLPMPDASADLLVTDPPYYDAVPYADLAEFFYVWLRRTVGDLHPDLLSNPAVPRIQECVVNPGAGKDAAHFTATMTGALAEARRVLVPGGIAVVIFAHKSTAGWEAQLQAMIDAGWMITASWPIDTEMTSRLRARNSAVLASSVHLVCRPRTEEATGELRDILAELPAQVRAPLHQLVRQGSGGADAIFACLGPALRLYSRYARVERTSGEAVPMAEYLREVFAVISREAVRMILPDFRASAFEADGRLTAMWLWAAAGQDGLALPYDTARKMAQGLGADLDDLARPGGIVAVEGGTARLLPPRARETARTVLDRLQHAMLLFAEGRARDLAALLLQPECGGDPRFRHLSQALSALYPAGSPERRWVEGVLSHIQR